MSDREYQRTDSPHPPDPGAPRRRLRYSLTVLLIGVTATAAYFAIPGGLLTVGSVVGWLVVGGVVLGVLITLQLPVFFLFDSLARSRDTDDVADRNGDTNGRIKRQ